MPAPVVNNSIFGALHLRLPSHLPGQVDLLDWCQQMGPATSAILVVAGVVYLLFGYYAFKVLVTANAALVASFFGAIIGHKAGSAWAGAIVAGVLVGAATWPLMKWAVALMGGVYGFVLGATMWRGAGLESQYIWAGGLIGLVGFGLFSFILFRACVIIYTSLQGSVMLVLGVLGFLYKYPEIGQGLTRSLTVKPTVIPMALMVITFVGLFYQQNRYPAANATPPKK